MESNNFGEDFSEYNIDTFVLFFINLDEIMLDEEEEDEDSFVSVYSDMNILFVEFFFD